MEALYKELLVPIDAMTSGLKFLKESSLVRLDAETGAIVGPYFDHLILHMDHFDED